LRLSNKIILTFGLAALAGQDAQTYGAKIEDRLRRVSELTEDVVAPPSVAPSEEAAGLGNVDHWLGFQALRSPRAVEIFRRVWPMLKDRLDRTTHPDEALAHFESFLSGLPAGVQLFSLFEANPQLLDLVVDVVDTAPVLGQYLAHNAGVFDAVIGGQFFSDWPGHDGLVADLTARLNAIEDYEKKLDETRVWQREWHFRVGVHLLRGLIDADTSGQQYADIAGAAVAGLWPAVVAQFATKHGAPPGRGAIVLAMGSLGAERLNATSDLDLIVIFDGGQTEASDGPRPLPTRTYFARLTQALVTAISAPTAEGRLYEVDMRLRPSGKQGPVATGLEAFRTYQTTEAWTWEHLALTRARPLVGDASLMADVEAVRSDVLARPRDGQSILADVADMRDRLGKAKPASHVLDARNGPGRLQDIELLAQTACLLSGSGERKLPKQLSSLPEILGIEHSDMRALQSAADLFWTVQARRMLILGASFPDDIGASAAAFLLRGTGLDAVKGLEEQLKSKADAVLQVIERHLLKPQ